MKMRNIVASLVLASALFSGAAFANTEFAQPAVATTAPQAGERLNLTILAQSGSCYSPPGQNCYLSYDWGYRRYVCVCYNNDNGGS